MTGHPRVVLLVDDSATMREVLKSAFRGEGMVVVPCHDGEAAMRSSEKLSPDIVVSDILMPGCDGFELCRRLRRHPALSAVPVILMSSVVSREVAEKAAAVGASELMRKPFQPRELVARVLHLLDPGAALQPSATPAPCGDAVVAAGLGTAAAMPQSAVAVLTEAMRLFSPPLACEPAPLAPQPSPPAAPAACAPAPATRAAAAAAPAGTPSVASDKGQLELQRLQALVRKLQTEVSAEREYAQTLESQIRSLHRE